MQKQGNFYFEHDVIRNFHKKYRSRRLLEQKLTNEHVLKIENKEDFTLDTMQLVTVKQYGLRVYVIN